MNAANFFITQDLVIPMAEFIFKFSRSSGPGGQNVNKVNSKVQLIFSLWQNSTLPLDLIERFTDKYKNQLTVTGEISITSNLYRDQKRNKEDCLEKLKAMILSVRFPPKKRIPTKPKFSDRENRLNRKKKAGQNKALRKKVRY